MKRKVKVVFLPLLLAVALVCGCGGAKAGSSTSKDDTSSKGETPSKNDTSSKDETPSKNETPSKDDTTTNPEIGDNSGNQDSPQSVVRLYDRVPEWDTVRLKEQPVQIFDTLYWAGTSLEDFIKKVKESKVDFTIERKVDSKKYEAINMERLVAVGGIETLRFSFYGTAYFECRVKNFFEDVKVIGELPVIVVSVYEDAYPYCRYFDGLWCYDDFMALGYADMPEFLKKMEESGYETRQDGLSYRVQMSSILKSSSWTNKIFGVSVIFDFKIDADTSKMSSFGYTTSGDGGYTDIPWYNGGKPWKISEISNLDRATERAIEGIKNAHPDCEINERVGIIIAKNSEDIDSAHLVSFVSFVFRVNDTQYASAYYFFSWNSRDYWFEYWLDGNDELQQNQRDVWSGKESLVDAYATDAYDSIESLMAYFGGFKCDIICDCDNEALLLK